MESQRYHFGDFQIDLARRLFYRGGLLLEPDRREFELLRLLVEAHPETLNRRDLIDRIWPNQEISDASLAQLIRRTRRLLGDSAAAPRYIKTIHGIGVRLIPRPEAQTGPESRSETAQITRIGLLPISEVDAAPGGAREIIDGFDSDFSHTILRRLETCRGLRIQLLPDASAVGKGRKELMDRFDCQALLQLHLKGRSLPRKLNISLFGPPDWDPVEDTLEANTLLETANLLRQRLPAMIRSLQMPQPQAREPEDDSDREAQELLKEARRFLERQQARDAADHYQAILDHWPELKVARAGLASALERMNRLDEAEDLVQALLDDEGLAPGTRMETRHVQCNLLYARGEIEASSELARQLVEEAERLDDDRHRIKALIKLGSSERTLGHDEAAMTALREAISLGRKTGEEVLEAMALHNLGNALLCRDTLLAQKCFEQAEILFDRNGIDRYQASANFQIGTLLRSAGELEHARASFIRARGIFEQTGDVFSLARADIELILIKALEGHYRESLQAFEKLLPRLEQDQLEFPAWLTRQLMARCWLNLHDPDRARPLLGDEPSLVPGDPSYPMLKAHCHYESGEFDKALQMARNIHSRFPDGWTESHQRLLEGYEKACESGQWKALPI